MSSDSLWLSAASPLFAYSPGGQFDSLGATASWTGVAAGQGGSPGNDSVKSTNGPAGLALGGIASTSFTPVWEDAQDVYQVEILGADSKTEEIASGQTISSSGFEVQNYTMMVKCSAERCAQAFTFSGANLGTKFVPDGSTVQTVTLDDASNAIEYTGFATVASNSTSGLTATEEDFEQTLSATSTSGAAAGVTFQGSAILVYGVSGPASGEFTATLDGSQVGTWSALNDAWTHHVVLFFATDLDTSKQHNLNLTAISGGTETGLVIDEFVAYGPQGGCGFFGPGGVITTSAGASTAASSPTSVVGNPSGHGGAPNAGVIVGAILGSLAGIILLIWLFRRGVVKSVKKEKKLNPWDEANLLQNMKNEEVFVTTVAKQRYVYPGLVAHSELKK